MKNLAYYNGAVGELTDMSIPMCDRVCFFGDGVYDATYARNKKVFTLTEHVDRLFFSAESVGIVPPVQKEKLCQLVRSLVTRCDENETFVYVQFTRGICVPRNHIHIGGDANLWITVTPKKITPKEKRLTLMTYPDERYNLCYVKTLNLLPNVQASNLAAKNGCDEALFVENGTVNECAHSNVHILSDGVLISPPPGNRVLGGIARNHLLSACKKLAVPVEERHFSLDEAMGADEVYITSAGTFLAPCRAIDGKEVGGGNIGLTNALQNELYGEFYAFTD